MAGWITYIGRLNTVDRLVYAHDTVLYSFFVDIRCGTHQAERNGAKMRGIGRLDIVVGEEIHADMLVESDSATCEFIGGWFDFK